MRIANLADRLVLVTDEGAIDVEKASQGRFHSDPQAVYERWAEFVDWASTATGDAEPFVTADLGPPVPRPRQVFAIGANYRGHAEEGGIAVPQWPMVFTKFVSSFAGPTGEIVLPSESVDWEVELVAVIGKRAYRVPSERGWDHVAGLTVGQDLSERKVQLRGEYPQMCMGKSFPCFSPFGPYLVTPQSLPSAQDLEIGCTVNGETMQLANTRDLIFSVPALIAHLSYVLPLEPGDVIFTGTPQGVGMARTPPRFLQPRDELVSYIAGIGEMRHTFIGSSSTTSS